jgi:hypothetical protein
MIERLFERLLTSWLFWGMMVAIALWLAIVEAFFPRHVPEFKPDSSAAVAGSVAGSRPGEQK